MNGWTFLEGVQKLRYPLAKVSRDPGSDKTFITVELTDHLIQTREYDQIIESLNKGLTPKRTPAKKIGPRLGTMLKRSRR